MRTLDIGFLYNRAAGLEPACHETGTKITKKWGKRVVMKAAIVASFVLACVSVRPALSQGLPSAQVDSGEVAGSVTVAKSTLAGGNSCRGRSSLSYIAPTSSSVGDTIRVSIKLGAGRISGGTTLSINRVRFNLDCDNTNPGINCPDDGPAVSYQGNLASNCPMAWTADHMAGDTLPNQVVFTPSIPLSIPANTESSCEIAFDVRIEALSTDGTPTEIEQVVGFDASQGDGVCNTLPALAAGQTMSGEICVDTLHGSASCQTSQTGCEIFPAINYPSAPRLLAVGSIARTHISFGAGHNPSGGPITIHRFRFNLDCTNLNLGINCADDGDVVSYEGNITTNCGVTWEASNAPGTSLPNQVIFTPNNPLEVPADTPDSCYLEFDTLLKGVSTDGTPEVIEQACGMEGTLGDALCSMSPPRATGDTVYGSLQLCPLCDDGNQCNGLEYCDGENGCAPGTPLICEDENVCTSDSCDPTIYEGDPCVFTDTSASCTDDNACTDTSCDPGLGCVVQDISAHCNDGSPCTSDACDPASGECIYTSLCDDRDPCTLESCDPSGCHHEANSCDDGNSCTDDACDPLHGCAHVGNGSCGANPRGLGYWKRLCRGSHPSGDFYTSEDLTCVRESCAFASTSSIDELCDRLSPNPPSDGCAKADAHLLALALNLCRGRVRADETMHSDCGSETTVGAAKDAIEERLCDPNRTAETCRDAACVAGEIDSGSALGVTSLRVRTLPGGGISLTWGLPYVSDDGAASPRYRVWRRPSSEAPFEQIAETHALAFVDGRAPAASAQYEITVIW